MARFRRRRRRPTQSIAKADLHVRHFDSLPEFGRDCKRVLGERASSTEGGDWYGGESFATAIERCETGDERYVSEAERLVEKFRDSVDISLLQPRWVVEPVGAFPSVPDFLAGQPECMWRRIQEESERAPLTIWACVTSSAGVGAKQLLARGIAITALYMALSATRAVNLRVFSGLGSYGDGPDGVVTVAFPQPIALSQAAFGFASQGFARGLTYKWIKGEFGTQGGWPSVIGHGKREERIEEWARVLGAGEDDIIFPHTFLHDEDVRDPIGYVQRLIAEFTNED